LDKRGKLTATEETASPALKPDISHLDWFIRLDVAVAESEKGASWIRDSGEDGYRFWELRQWGKPLFRVRIGGTYDGLPHRLALPSLARGAAAWGALLTRERVSLKPITDEWWEADGAHKSRLPGVAVGLAVLARRGVLRPSGG
jgi:hypothetical protein